MHKIYTLARDGRARLFGYNETESEVEIFTGKDFLSKFIIRNKLIAELLEFFRGKEWFFLGNQVNNIKPNGLGDYFKSILGASPKYSSHVAAYLVKKGKLLFRDDCGLLEFKVK